MSFFAHSENRQGNRHDLVAHLKSVAQKASGFAGKFGGSEFGYWAGLWHDLGKFHPDFQSYIASPGRHRGPDHSSAGAVHALDEFDLLAFLVAGHHAGLPSKQALKERLREKAGSSQVEKALDLARHELPHVVPDHPLLQQLPEYLKRIPATRADGEQLIRETELFLRIVFSSLVDADFLDTEAHFDSDRSTSRVGTPSLEQLWGRFEEDQEKVTGLQEDRLNKIRDEIYWACIHAGDAEQEIFSLTIPTGGGKTRSGMGFALRHALRHGLDRVVVAIPYTSIIEQTADIYRNIFGDGVLEHHAPWDSGKSPVTPSLGKMYGHV